MTPARNGLRSHAVVGSRSSEAKGELGLGRGSRPPTAVNRRGAVKVTA
jgi:hypothetical protein